MHTLNKPANNILIISDNPELSQFLKKKFNEPSFKRINKIDFAYTEPNKNPAALQAFGASKINVKDLNIVSEIISKYDLVFSIHCKQIFPAHLVENICCINSHPGLNPYNRGWYPQAFSIVNGLPIGATLHLMDADVDHGPIIDQQRVQILESDTSLEVYRKVIQTEKDLLNKNLLSIVNADFSYTLPSENGNYNSIKDYRDMCILDLTHTGTMREHINLLRATSHANFKNAYFIDENNEQIFVKIELTK